MFHIDTVSDIERIFQEDVADRKRTASSRTLNKSVSRKVWFPSDVMSRKDKYTYKRNGKVWCYNMYDEILGKDKFDELPEAEQRKALLLWRAKYTVTEVQRKLGMQNYTYYKLLQKYGIETTKAPPKQSKGNPSTLAPAPSSQPDHPAQIVELVRKEELMEIVASMRQLAENQQSRNLSDGVSLNMKGTFDSKTAASKLMKFASIIEDENSQFNITIMIEEAQ